MKIKTSKLTGSALDWAVAKATGLDVTEEWPGSIFHQVEKGTVYLGRIGKDYRPSRDWSQGGPLAYQHLIDIAHSWNGWGSVYVTAKHAGRPDSKPMQGETALIAACRAIVSYLLGDEVEVPDELVGGAS